MEILTLIVEYIIEQFLLIVCQKKGYKPGYVIFKEFVAK